MSILKSIRLSFYRNFDTLELTDFSNRQLVVGVNGSGKTNFLEAIYFLCCLKSFRTHKLGDLVEWGRERALISGQIQGYHGVETYEVAFDGKQRNIKRNDCPIATTSDYLTGICAVSFCPEDAAIVQSEPRERRNLLDRILFNINKGYL